jgi:ParB-like chromosome segregation protein Spo0J
MSETLFQEVKDDIATKGLFRPIVVKDGLIIDGRARYRACIELGIEPETRESESETPEEIEAEIRSLNFSRRALTEEQRREAIRQLRIQQFPSGTGGGRQ